MYRSQKKIARFFARYPKKTFRVHRLVLGGEQEVLGVMYILKGYVRQYILSEDGVEQTTMIYGPGDIFSLIWAVSGKERKYRYFETMTQVTLAYCPRDDFISFLKRYSDSEYLVLEQSLSRFDDLLQRLAYVSMAGKARMKIVVFLFLLCRRFGDKKRHYLLPFPLKHKDIAACLGVARETVSIATKKLLDEKIVIQKGFFLGIQLKRFSQKEKVFLQDVLE